MEEQTVTYQLRAEIRKNAVSVRLVTATGEVPLSDLENLVMESGDAEAIRLQVHDFFQGVHSLPDLRGRSG